jgi:hypothetical protein
MSDKKQVYVDIDEATGTMIVVANKEIKIPVYFTIDDEIGIIHYDTDSMRDEFDKEIARIEKEVENE